MVWHGSFARSHQITLKSSPRHFKAGRVMMLLRCLILPVACASYDSENSNVLRDVRESATALEGRLSAESASTFHRIRLQLESTFEAERWARHEAVEAQLDKLLAVELRSLVELAKDNAIPSGIPELEFGKFAPQSFPSSIRRLHNETEEPGLVLCTACQEEASEILPLGASLPIIGVLVALSGLFSGLTLGLMGLDMTGLRIVAAGGDDQAKKNATKIMPVRESGNQLLCTLLLGNVAVNSALSILTAEIASGLVGFLVSTGLIVVFGEILPQAACSRYALQVGACTVPIVNLLMGLFYILTKPMSLMLDCLLGREVGTIYTKKELEEMLKLQISLGAVDQATGKMAQQVAEGAISFRDKQVKDVMTPLKEAYMLQTDTALGYDTVRDIFEKGYSRIPCYGRDKNDYRGLLYTKDLMMVDPEDEMKVGDFIGIFNRKVETFFGGDTLANCLHRFRNSRTHIGLVRQVDNNPNLQNAFSVEGVLTLEDIMEEILQEEIVDETDNYLEPGVPLTKKQEYNFGVFNTVWKNRNKVNIHPEEVAGFVAHLSRSVFIDDPDDINGLCLSEEALQWLICTSEVVIRHRATPLGNEEPVDEDRVYVKGRHTDTSLFILQGRLSVRVGLECFRSEAGTFTLLAKDALRLGQYKPDFDAFLCTNEVRYLVLSRSKYKAAQALDKNKPKLEQALEQIKQEGLHGASSRKEAARALKLRDGGDEGSPRKNDDPWLSERQSGYSVATSYENSQRPKKKTLQQL
mmetsp:Transcript_28250/g.44797  ORF Transcript_28250/g.44797 Transcript_28250/m.44797 type:complete len:752 (+) Transcript_28250:78-2333(+)